MFFYSIIKIVRALYKTVVALVYYYATKIIPKQKNVWVFGCWKGKTYGDNSRALFEYVNAEHPEINAIWIAKNRIVYEKVKKLGFNVVLYPSIKAYYLVSRAYINIQTESNEDTGKYRVGGAIIVQLFHGYGAPKELYLYGNMGSLKKKIVKLYADDHSKSYWMVPSEYFVNRFPVVCETDPMKMFVTGQPRTDVLLRKMEVPYLENYIKDHAGKKFILYTPTHRNYAQDNNIAFTRLEWDRLNDFMKEEGFYLFFKPHPLELFKYRDGFRQYSNIVLVADNLKDYDISEYMHYFDLLISDYSSISSDFLIFNRPIIHFMYDRDSYVTNSCNLDALDAFCAGPICNSFEELFHNIKLSLTLPDFYLERREVAKKNALKYCDANNCLRVYETIVNKII